MQKRHAKRKSAAAPVEPSLAPTDLPTPPQPETELERAKVVFWEPLLRQFPTLTHSEVLVVTVFAQFPAATVSELAEKCGLARQTVSAILNSDHWGALLRAYMVQRGDALAGKALIVLEKWVDSLIRQQARGFQPEADDKPLLEMVMKRAGLLAPDVSVTVNASGSAAIVIGQELDATLVRLQALATGPQSQGKPAVSCDIVPAQVSKLHTEGAK
jgi:hypothetical protein